MRAGLTSLGAGAALPPVFTLPRGGQVPPGAGRPPPSGVRKPAALRDPGCGMGRRAGPSAGRLRAGSFRGSQEAGVAIGPPGEREGRRDRGRVPLSASQRLRQGGFPGADGISARRPAKAWLLLCFWSRVRLGKSLPTRTASLAATQLAPASSLTDSSEHPFLLSSSLLPRAPLLCQAMCQAQSGSTRVQTRTSPLCLTCRCPSSPLWLSG